MSTPAYQPLQVGDEMPDIELLDEQGQVVNLREAARDSTVIVFFYPRDNGVRCRTQACGMRDSWPLLRSEGIEVYGVNHASADSHRQFRDRYGLPFPLLVDRDLHLARAFGFVNRWMPPGVSPLERSTVVIDPGGTIRAVMRRVKPTAHFDILRADLGLPQREFQGEAASRAPVELTTEDALVEVETSLDIDGDGSPG